MVMQGTVPDTLKWNLFTAVSDNNKDDITIIRLAFNRSTSVHVLIDGERVEGFYDYDIPLTKHGENRWYYRNNTIEYLIQDTRTKGVLVTTVVDAVFLTLKLSVPLSTFYDSGKDSRNTQY